jgi:hypothetical protein
LVGFNFITGDRDQAFSAAGQGAGWLPADHLVWFAIDVVDQCHKLRPASPSPDGGRSRRAFTGTHLL